MLSSGCNREASYRICQCLRLEGHLVSKLLLHPMISNASSWSVLHCAYKRLGETQPPLIDQTIGSTAAQYRNKRGQRARRGEPFSSNASLPPSSLLSRGEHFVA